MPEREAMALGLDGDALDRGRHAGSGQRLPTTKGSQAASNVAGRSGSPPQQGLTRQHCSPSHRRLTSISAATASQCSTKRRDIPLHRGGIRWASVSHLPTVCVLKSAVPLIYIPKETVSDFANPIGRLSYAEMKMTGINTGRR